MFETCQFDRGAASRKMSTDGWTKKTLVCLLVLQEQHAGLEFRENIFVLFSVGKFNCSENCITVKLDIKIKWWCIMDGTPNS